MIPIEQSQVNNNICSVNEAMASVVVRQYLGSRAEITISADNIKQANLIDLYKTDKALFLLIGKMIEVGGWCKASRRSLSFMLSEKISNLLSDKQISRVSGRLAALKLISKSQTIKSGQCSQNEYQLTGLGWALFYIFHHRIDQNQKCPTVKPKNVPPLITLSLNEDCNNTSVPRFEIPSPNEPTNSEVVDNVHTILDKKLCGLSCGVADTVRRQVVKYVSHNKITSIEGLINKIITRESEAQDGGCMSLRNKSLFANALKAQCDVAEADKLATAELLSLGVTFPTTYDEICAYRERHAALIQKHLHPPKATSSPMPPKQPANIRPHWSDR